MAIAWVDAGGVSLRYELSGAGPETIVLLHEMAGTLESWDALAPMLQPHYRILRYDMRGAGLSEKIRGEVSGDQLADDLGALLDALDLRAPVALVGCAVGANVALRFAARHSARTAMLLVSSPATSIPPDRRAATLAMIAKFECDGLRTIEAVSLATSYPEILRAQNPQRFAATRLRWLANDPASFAAVFRMLVASDLTGVFGTITAPSLFIGCTLDSARPPEQTAAIATQVSGSTYVTLDTGHFAAIQSPAVLCALLLPFIDRHRDRF
ncbi:alpha/beta fold hydrolase [Acidisphaera sp. L21]|uniref:alpha/beta fold hydrolase n=1 Tax=Acidisphaera sp. L21 TaxID=1641851 RepID=UPI00131B0D9F|nr:alpha/beta fold hydrolase [Acidisphaera sp. L21]